MAKKYENVENVLKLLEDEQLGGVLKRLSSTEKSLSDILKKLAVLETEKAEREAQATEKFFGKVTRSCRLKIIINWNGKYEADMVANTA